MVTIDLDFMISLQDGTPSDYAYNIIVENMPTMIAAYLANGQTQLANWLQDAMNQVNANRNMVIFDAQYFFIMAYVDLGGSFTTYTKAQLLGRFIP